MCRNPHRPRRSSVCFFSDFCVFDVFFLFSAVSLIMCVALPDYKLVISWSAVERPTFCIVSFVSINM